MLQALEQFKDTSSKGKWSDKIYTNFYARRHYDYFLQGDLVREIRYPNLNKHDKSFERTFTDALILSNTCDLDVSNLRKLHKQVVLAPLLELQQFVEESAGMDGFDEIIQGVKSQTASNIFYMPPNPGNGKEYICHLTKPSGSLPKNSTPTSPTSTRPASPRSTTSVTTCF